MSADAHEAECAPSVVTVDFRKRRRRKRRVTSVVIDAGEGEEPAVPETTALQPSATVAADAEVHAALAALGASAPGGTGAAPSFPLPLVVPEDEGAEKTVPADDAGESKETHESAQDVPIEVSPAPDVVPVPEDVEEEAVLPPAPEPEQVPQVTPEPVQKEEDEEEQKQEKESVVEVVTETAPSTANEKQQEEQEEKDESSSEESSEIEEEKEEEKDADDKPCDESEAPPAPAPAVVPVIAEKEKEEETTTEVATDPPVISATHQEQEREENNQEKELEARAEMMQRVVTTFVNGALVIADYDQDDTKRTVSQIVEARLRASAATASTATSGDTPKEGTTRDVEATRTPPSSWMPLVTEVHFYVPERGTVAAQGGVCYGCGAPLSAARAALNRGRYCHYTGRFFCRRCFGQGWRSAILGRVVHDWDFRELPVNRRSAEFLRAVAAEPVIDVGALNPRLYAAVPLLQDVRLVRRKLLHLRDYIACCPRLAPDSECRALLARLPRHLYATTEMYSLADLRALSALLARLLAAVHVWLAHATACELCTQKGSFCELCHSDALIYPYQVQDVVQCPQCKGVFHRACYAAADVCPKCLRLVARQLTTSHDPSAS